MIIKTSKCADDVRAGPWRPDKRKEGASGNPCQNVGGKQEPSAHCRPVLSGSTTPHTQCSAAFPGSRRPIKLLRLAPLPN